VSYAQEHSVRQRPSRLCNSHGWARTADRSMVTMACYENCDTHAVDGRARLYSLHKCAKTLHTSAQ